MQKKRPARPRFLQVFGSLISGNGGLGSLNLGFRVCLCQSLARHLAPLSSNLIGGLFMHRDDARVARLSGMVSSPPRLRSTHRTTLTGLGFIFKRLVFSDLRANFFSETNSGSLQVKLHTHHSSCRRFLSDQDEFEWRTIGCHLESFVLL